MAFLGVVLGTALIIVGSVMSALAEPNGKIETWYEVGMCYDEDASFSISGRGDVPVYPVRPLGDLVASTGTACPVRFTSESVDTSISITRACHTTTTLHSCSSPLHPLSRSPAVTVRHHPFDVIHSRSRAGGRLPRLLRLPANTHAADRGLPDVAIGDCRCLQPDSHESRDAQLRSGPLLPVAGDRIGRGSTRSAANGDQQWRVLGCLRSS